MEYLVAIAIVGLVVVAAKGYATALQLSEAFNELLRENDACHAAQVSELCNRIQLPERTAHVSVSESSPPSQPYVHPDVEEELSALG